MKSFSRTTRMKWNILCEGYRSESTGSMYVLTNGSSTACASASTLSTRSMVDLKQAHVCQTPGVGFDEAGGMKCLASLSPWFLLRGLVPGGDHRKPFFSCHKVILLLNESPLSIFPPETLAAVILRKGVSHRRSMFLVYIASVPSGGAYVYPYRSL